MARKQEEIEVEYEGDGAETEFELPEYFETPDYEAKSPGLYNLKVAGAQIVPGKTTPDRRIVKVVLEFVDEPEADYIYENFPMPLANDKGRGKVFMTRRWRRFCTAFEVPVSETGKFKVDDLVGLSAQVPVIVDSKTNRNVLDAPKY